MRKLDSFGSVSLSRLLIACAAMLLAGGSLGYGIGSNRETMPVEQPPSATAQPVQDVASMGAETVSPAASLHCRYAFSCGHALERQEDARAVIGKTEAEVTAIFSEAKLLSFSPDLVALEYECEECCPAHYVLAWQEDALSVFATDAQTLEYEKLIALDGNGLNEEERTALSGGLCFDSLEEINLYLEGLDE